MPDIDRLRGGSATVIVSVSEMRREPNKERFPRIARSREECALFRRSVSLVAALGMVVVGCTDVRNSDEYQALEAELDQAQTDLSEVRTQLEEALGSLAESESELEATHGELAQAKEALDLAEEQVVRLGRELEAEADLADRADLSNISNETLSEAVDSSPEIYGLRLALAERYYNDDDFQAAFPHYFEVAESPDSSDAQAVLALVRLGWMAWESNGDMGVVVELFDHALAIDPSSWLALHHKGLVLWCGDGDHAMAKSLFEEALADPDLTGGSRSQVASDLDLVASGADCS